MAKPTKYTKEMPDKLLKYFEDKKRFEIEIVKKFSKDGDLLEEKEVKRPLSPPTIEGFGAENKIGKSTLYDWAARYPEFKEAMEIAKQIQADHIIANSMEGLNNNAFPIFMMKNCHNWTDRVEQKIESNVTLEKLVGDSFEEEDN